MEVGKINMHDRVRVDRSLRRNIHEMKSKFTGTPKQWLHFERLCKQPRFEQKTPVWLQMRHQGITASDFGAALGISPYETTMHFIKKKCGLEPKSAFVGNKFTEHGVFYEDVALALYEQKTGVYTFDFGLLLHHDLFNIELGDSEQEKCAYVELLHKTVPDLVFVKGSPDGVAWCGKRNKWVSVEIKCPSSIDRIYPGRVPDYYMPQCQLNMYLTGTDCMDFVQFFPAETTLETDFLDVTEIRFDQKWMDAALANARDVWSCVEQIRKGELLFHEYCLVPPTLPEWEQQEVVQKHEKPKRIKHTVY